MEKDKLGQSRERNAMSLVDACRSPIRRKIMIVAEEAAQANKVITATSMAQSLDVGLAKASYHVKLLAQAGALKTVGGQRMRGAYQVNYVPSEAFQATMTDTVALDQIAELIDGERPTTALAAKKQDEALKRLIQATGRPVEA